MTRKKEDKIPKPDGKLEKPVILIGMMGAGKSSIGKMLAAHIGAHFIDSDTEIEKAAKMTIPEIFKLHGEAYFRDGEKRVFKRLLEGQPAIIAAGGRLCIYPNSRDYFGVRLFNLAQGQPRNAYQTGQQKT